MVNDNVNAFRLSLEYGRDKDKSTSGIFIILPGSVEGMHRIFSISYSQFWNAALKKLIRRLYPEAMAVFFKQSEMWQALMELNVKLPSKHRVIVSEVTMKRKVMEPLDQSHPQIETDRLWTELSIEEAFSQAQEGGYWFTSVKFEVQKATTARKSLKTVAQGRLYKYGAIDYDFLHDEIDSSVITLLEKNAADRLDLLSNRGIRARSYHPGRPIQITYGRDIFSETIEVHRFGEVISSYPKSTRAVFHPNPYYHASVADFEDGSSMELWVLSPRRILIVPQAKCTERALQRLISHIFFKFNEGELGEYEG
jgi:hypothetical protein